MAANWFQNVFGGGRRRSRNSNANGNNERRFSGSFPTSLEDLGPALEASLDSIFQQQQQPSGAAPPASRKVIRQLPTVTVAPEDLVEESNRECCICLEQNHLKDRVTRLPCAHIYHPHCILDWLGKHCTCPVCRYELPTDDAAYERGRLERMKHYKPRFARYELERMSISHLRELCFEKNIRIAGILTRQDLIAVIIDSGKIDLVAAPKPVEYPLSLLKAMGVGELKRCMADAGVFFDPVDVVEKQDMIYIFINSGRLEIVEEEECEETKLPTEANSSEPKVQNGRTSKKRKQGHVLVETVTESDDEEEFQDGKMPPRTINSSRSCFMDYNENFVEPESEQATAASSREDDSAESTTEPVVDSASSNHSSARGSAAVEEEEAAEDEDEEANVLNGTHAATLAECGIPDTDSQSRSGVEATETSPSQKDVVDESGDVEMEDVFELDDTVVENEIDQTEPAVPPPAVAFAQFQEQSIAELREIARRLGIDLSGCIERSEMVDRLHNTPATLNHDPPTVQADDFDSWTVSGLRGAGKALGIDMSLCSDRCDMVQQLVEAAQANQRVASYLNALAPLGRLSVSELRAVAREWRVNVSDCLEKGEMINRLVLAGGPQ